MKKIFAFTLVLFAVVSCQNNDTIVSDIVPEQNNTIEEGNNTEATNQRVGKTVSLSASINTNKEITSEPQAMEATSVKIENTKVITEKSQGEKLLNQNVKAPDLIGLTNWFNGEEIKSLEELKGKVVFIDFWTYTCINCIRTLGHMQEMHEKYGEDGLVILGIHAPEFSYERKIENVVAAAQKYGLTYRIAQDNDFKTWRNYKNRYWPAQYIINKEGVLRYVHFGEGAYEEMEKVVEFLLSE